MKVIGAGLPRTATTTQLVALEQLGFAPCYHMRDLLGDLEARLPAWERAGRGRPGLGRRSSDRPSRAATSRRRATTASSRRSTRRPRCCSACARPRAGCSSMRETIWPMYHGDSVMRHSQRRAPVVDPLWQRFLALMGTMLWNERTGALAGGTRRRRRSRRGHGALERRGQGRRRRPSGCSSGNRQTAGSRCASSSRSRFRRARYRT